MKKLLSILTPVLAFCLASLVSYNVSALNFGATDTRNYVANNSNDSGIYLTNNEGTSYFLYHDSNNLVYVMSSGGLNLAIPTNTSVVNGVRLKFNAQTPNKYIMNVAYRFCPANPDNLRSWIGFSSNAYNALISQDWIVNGSCINGSISVFGAQARYAVELGAINGGLQVGSIAAGGSIVFNKPTFIVLSDDADYTAVLNAIKNNTDNIKTKLDTLHTDMGNLKSSMDGVAEQEERVADVAEDEYNKTIQDEQTASSGAGGFSFNFSLPNPFTIFQVSDGCVNTPTIDSWLHLEGDWKSPHCPLIPANVRNVLTPVVTLIVTLATLLVVIRWVSSSAVDVAGSSVSSLTDKTKGDKS